MIGKFTMQLYTYMNNRSRTKQIFMNLFMNYYYLTYTQRIYHEYQRETLELNIS